MPVRVLKDEAAPVDPPAPMDMVSGTPLADTGRDMAKGAGVLGRLALRTATRQPGTTALAAVAAGIALGALLRARRRGKSR